MLRKRAADAAYKRSLLRRKYWEGPGTSRRWLVVCRTVVGNSLVLLCGDDSWMQDHAVFVFHLPTLRRSDVPADKFASGYLAGLRLFTEIVARLQVPR